MPKYPDAQNEAQIDAQFHKPAFLISIGHASGSFYASSTVALSYDSKTWQRLDAKVDSFIQGVDGAAQIRMTFPKPPSPLAAMVARDELRGQPIDVHKGFVDDNGDVVGAPDFLLAGRFDYGSVNANGVTINIAEGAAARHGRAPGSGSLHRCLTMRPSPRKKSGLTAFRPRSRRKGIIDELRQGSAPRSGIQHDTRHGNV